MKQPGYLVETSKGKLGRTYHSEKFVDGKIIVHLIDEKHNPILNEKQDPIKILCNPDSLKLIGYVD